MDSFIVKAWLAFLSWLRFLSPFQWICWASPALASSYGFVDAWVLGHTALCIGLLTVFQLIPDTAGGRCEILVCTYGTLRVLEIVSVNATNLFFQAPIEADPTQAYALRGYRRMVILALHNYAEVVLWFGIFYRALMPHFVTGTTCGTNKSVCFAYFSLVTMATVGYGDITPNDNVGRALVVVQVAVAMFLTIIILARVVGYLPQPPSLDRDERRRQ